MSGKILTTEELANHGDLLLMTVEGDWNGEAYVRRVLDSHEALRAELDTAKKERDKWKRLAMPITQEDVAPQSPRFVPLDPSERSDEDVAPQEETPYLPQGIPGGKPGRIVPNPPDGLGIPEPGSKPRKKKKP